MPGPPGAHILAEGTSIDVPFPPALDPAVDVLGHHAICDPTTEFPRDGERPNPQPCGHAPAHDCYELTIISSTSAAFITQLWGTPAQCLERIEAVRDAIGPIQINGCFSYAGLDYDEAEASMRLFAEECLPVVKDW